MPSGKALRCKRRDYGQRVFDSLTLHHFKFARAVYSAGRINDLLRLIRLFGDSANKAVLKRARVKSVIAARRRF